MGEPVSGIRTKILKHMERDRKQIVRLCSQLIQIPSENPPGDTTDIAAFLTDFLSENGISVRRHEPKKGAPNLIGSIGPKGERKLVFSGHMDVLPAGKGWKKSPFSGAVGQGKIFGRGACDMKTGLTASLSTLLAASRHESSLSGRLTICLVSDEETGGNWGTKWMIDNEPEANGTACLIGEPGGIDVVPIGEKGIFWLQLQATGNAAHGAYDTLGDNAVMTMSRALPEILKMRRTKGKIPKDLKAIIRSERPYVEEKYGKGIGQVLTRVSVSPGSIVGGVALNMIPEFCNADVDVRLPIGVTAKSAQSILRRILSDAGLDSKVTPQMKVMSDPNYTSPKNEFVETVRKNVQRALGRNPRMLIKIGATDGRYYRLKGVPTVTYGPGLYNMSRADEYVPISEVLMITDVYGSVAADYLSPV